MRISFVHLGEDAARVGREGGDNGRVEESARPLAQRGDGGIRPAQVAPDLADPGIALPAQLGPVGEEERRADRNPSAGLGDEGREDGLRVAGLVRVMAR